MSRVINVQGGVNPNPPSPRPPGGGTTTKPGTLGGNPGLVTSSGGVIGTNSQLLVPFYDKRSNKFLFATYDATNFNCEEDCIYDFKMEDVKLGRVVDIHKVYLQYRDLGSVNFTVMVTAVQLDRVTHRETISRAVKPVVILGTRDGKIHSRFVDLKIVGERPQLNITRRADSGPLSIVTAMLIGNMAEEEQL